MRSFQLPRLPAVCHLVFGHLGSCEQRWFEKLFFFASKHQAQLQLHIVSLLPFYVWAMSGRKDRFASW
jgi:hypothetical protein